MGKPPFMSAMTSNAGDHVGDQQDSHRKEDTHTPPSNRVRRQAGRLEGEPGQKSGKSRNKQSHEIRPGPFSAFAAQFHGHLASLNQAIERAKVTLEIKSNL